MPCIYHARFPRHLFIWLSGPSVVHMGKEWELRHGEAPTTASRALTNMFSARAQKWNSEDLFSRSYLFSLAGRSIRTSALFSNLLCIYAAERAARQRACCDLTFDKSIFFVRLESPAATQLYLRVKYCAFFLQHLMSGRVCFKSTKSFNLCTRNIHYITRKIYSYCLLCAIFWIE